jgi:iron-sulfur cluster repair protein YtfE (RIC family)
VENGIKPMPPSSAAPAPPPFLAKSIHQIKEPAVARAVVIGPDITARTTDMPDIYDLLSKDHNKVKELLKKIKGVPDGDEKSRQALFSELKQELEIHTSFEEKVFYPEAKQKTGLDDVIQDAMEEHDEAKQLLEALADMEPTSPEWLETTEELAEALGHHIKDEEQKLFPAARKTIDPTEAEKLGRDYVEMKEKALS